MKISLINCEDEKIQFLNQIQSFGYLIGVSKDDLKVKFYSENIIDLLPASFSINQPIQNYFDLEYDAYQSLIEGQYIRENITINEEQYYLNVYNYCNFIYLEFEKNNHSLDYILFFKYAEYIEAAMSEEDNWKILTNSIKQLIEYDRVMIYRFLNDNSGVVIEEAVDDHLEPYLGMHFPEFDIPIQARSLYLKKKSRLVSNINAKRIDIITENNQTIDLTYSDVRALSPTHMQYLKNFNSQSSFSISIIIENKLWGLVTCQSTTPKHIPATVRKKAEILTNLARDYYNNFKYNKSLKIKDEYRHNLVQLKEQLIVSEEFNEVIFGLSKMLEFTKSDAVALLVEDKVYKSKNCPKNDEIQRIKNWALTNKIYENYSSVSFYKNHKDELDLSLKSAGISFKFLDIDCRYFLIWFREPIIDVKKWAGKPAKLKVVEINENEVLNTFSPRENFSIWLEKVENESAFWNYKERVILEEIGKIVIDSIYVKSQRIHDLYNQLKDVNSELESFAHTISHDLRTPLTVMKLNCQILQKSLLSQESDSKKIKYVISEIDNLSNMINDILQISRTNNAELNIQQIDANELINRIISASKVYNKADKTIVNVGELIDFYADKTMAYEIFLNVINNAFKYSSKKEKPEISITSEIEDNFVIYRIKDNGIGIRETERNKMFKLFSRMDNTDGFEGEGVGLSIVHRMMKRLNGEITFISEENIGTEFIIKFKNI